MFLYTFCLPYFLGKIKKNRLEAMKKNHAHHDGRRGNIRKENLYTSAPTTKSPVPSLPNSVPLTRSYM